MKSGIIERLSKYLVGCKGDVRFHGNAELQHSTLQSYLASLIQFDCPDAYSVAGDAVCIIEHFEFDSTQSTKKGSKSKRVVDRIDKGFSKVKPTEEGVALRDYSYDAHHNAYNYIKNVLHNLNNHYVKIDTYTANLKKKGVISDTQSLEIGFFIEDTTILGNVYDAGGWPQPVTPVILPYCKQFLDAFEKCVKLDFCLCASSYSSTDFLWFINRASINDYRVHQIDLETITIIDFQPKVTGFKIVVPNEKVT